MLAQSVSFNQSPVRSVSFSRPSSVFVSSFGMEPEKNPENIRTDGHKVLKAVGEFFLNRFKNGGKNIKEGFPLVKEDVENYVHDTFAKKGTDLKTSGRELALNTAMPLLTIFGSLAVEWGIPLETFLIIVGSVPGAGKYLVKILTGKTPSELIPERKAKNSTKNNEDDEEISYVEVE